MWYYNATDESWSKFTPQGIKEHTVELHGLAATVVVVPCEWEKDGETGVTFKAVGVRMEEVATRRSEDGFTLPGKVYFYKYNKSDEAKISETKPLDFNRIRGTVVSCGGWPEVLKPVKTAGVYASKHSQANLLIKMVKLAEESHRAWIAEQRALAAA